MADDAPVGPWSGSAPPASSITVIVRYFAAARAAAATAEESLIVPISAAGCSVASVLEIATARHGARLADVLLRCSFLLDEVAVHGIGTTVTDGQLLDVLPPFAGG